MVAPKLQREKHLMTKCVYFFALIVAMNAATLFAQEKPAEGSLTLSKKTWQLSQGVAYETNAYGDERTVVVLSNQPITAQKLKEARAAEKSGGSVEFKRPYLRFEFKKNGELIQWN